MRAESILLDNGAGWRLALRCYRDEARVLRSRAPLLLIPGYGMNSRLFVYHPDGTSIKDALVAAGFEVWTVDLRAQGDSECLGGSARYGLAEAALGDLPLVIAHIARQTESTAKTVDLLGCSLGGSYMYAVAALRPELPIGRLVGIGAPLRWDEVHPLVRLAFASPRVASLLKMSHTRELAATALPLLRRLPWLLRLYIHPEITSLAEPERLAAIVEDPNPQLNYEISLWLRDRDLILNGRNVCHELGRVEKPLLLILATADGIVPAATARSALSCLGGSRKSELWVGSAAVPMAHADLFISRYSEPWVFAPLIAWLNETP